MRTSSQDINISQIQTWNNLLKKIQRTKWKKKRRESIYYIMFLIRVSSKISLTIFIFTKWEKNEQNSLIRKSPKNNTLSEWRIFSWLFFSMYKLCYYSIYLGAIQQIFVEHLLCVRHSSRPLRYISDTTINNASLHGSYISAGTAMSVAKSITLQA